MGIGVIGSAEEVVYGTIKVVGDFGEVFTFWRRASGQHRGKSVFAQTAIVQHFFYYYVFVFTQFFYSICDISGNVHILPSCFV